jgi:predicted metal-dependent hydrolase
VLRVEVGGRAIDVAVRVSTRSRRPRIVVDARRAVEIVLPPGTGPRVAERLLAEHRGWLERQLAKPELPFVLGLQRDDAVWVGGVPRPLPGARPLERWYREQARALTGSVAVREAGRLRVTYRSLAIRDQRSRWGSCSATGTLSFNWRLVLAPADVLAYVVVHELCHRLRPDHSRAFWELVGDARPSFRRERAWLRRHGAELLAYRPPDPEPARR